MYGSKHRTTDGLYETQKDGSGYSSTKREWNLQTHGFNDDSSNHRKYIRTQSSSNNRNVPSSSSSQQQRQNGDKEKKTVKDPKKPLRVSGDWSEFKSSTGKTYFYNCKTEISQWEKPKGWPMDESSSVRTSTTSSSSTDRIKKESTTTNSSISSTVRSRYKMDESSQNSRHQHSSMSNFKQHQNGDVHPHVLNKVNQESLQSNETLNTSTSNVRLPSPGDDSSRMSFSSTSSKESLAVTISNRNGGGGNENNGIVLHSSLSEPAVSVSTPVPDIPIRPLEKDPTSLNGKDAKSSTTRSNIPPTTTEKPQTTEIEPTTPSLSKAERDQEIQKYYRADLIQHLTDWSSTQLEKQCLKLFDDYYGYSAKTSTAFTELKALKSNFRVLEIKRNILTQRLLRCQQQIKKREDDKLL